MLQLFSTHLSDGVGLLVVDNRCGTWAVGLVAGHNLSGVCDIAVVVGSSAEGEGSSDNRVTHFS